MSKCFILLLTYIKWKQIPRYFSCLFKIRHFSCSKDRCPDICLTWWPRGSETQDGYDSVCMLNGKRTEQNKIMKHWLWFSATLNILNASQFTDFWNVVGIKPEIICMLKTVVWIINEFNILFILARICWQLIYQSILIRVCSFSRWYFMIKLLFPESLFKTRLIHSFSWFRNDQCKTFSACPAVKCVLSVCWFWS